MDTKSLCIAFGAIFIVVGLLGLVPNPVVAPGGIFAVNTAHNLVHLLTGAALLVGALALGQSRLTLQIVAVAYALVAILGFFSGDMLLGFIRINAADRWLHVALAAALIAAAWFAPQPRRIDAA